MWFNEPIIVGGIAGSILLSFKQDARITRIEWSDEFPAILEDVTSKSKEVAEHLQTARKGSKFNFIINLHGSAMHVIESAQNLLGNTKTCVEEMEHLITRAETERAELMSKVSPIISSSFKKEIMDEVKLLDNINGLVSPDLNKVKQERHDLKKGIKRLRVLNDEIKIAVGFRYGTRGKAWANRQEAIIRRLSRKRR
ncbi:MAG: hypothetical protein GY835_25755 [bacterium]|nr:hypothetical protein [bacterium]